MGYGNQSPRGSRMDLWAARLNRLSRPVRILLSLGITLEGVILLSLVIDRALINRVVEGEVDAMVPALIATGLGLVLYALGWWALVGFDLEPGQPWRARRASVLYAAAGAAALVLLVILILFGLVFGYVL